MRDRPPALENLLRPPIRVCSHFITQIFATPSFTREEAVYTTRGIPGGVGSPGGGLPTPPWAGAAGESHLASRLEVLRHSGDPLVGGNVLDTRRHHLASSHVLTQRPEDKDMQQMIRKAERGTAGGSKSGRVGRGGPKNAAEHSAVQSVHLTWSRGPRPPEEGRGVVHKGSGASRYYHVGQSRLHGERGVICGEPVARPFGSGKLGLGTTRRALS